MLDKLCPMGFNNTSVDRVRCICLGPACGWYLTKKGCCAVVALVDEDEAPKTTTRARRKAGDSD